MRLLLVVSALLGVWCQGGLPLRTQSVGSSNVSFAINVTSTSADVWVQFVDNSSLSTSWTGLGFAATSSMTSGGQGSDIFLCEAAGTVGRYWVTSYSPPTGRTNVPGGTCNHTSVGGKDIKTMWFTRALANLTTTQRAIPFGSSYILLAKGPYPTNPHQSSDRVAVPVTIAAPANVPTPAPTAAPKVVIPGYPLGTFALDSKVKIAWTEVANSQIRFAFEATLTTASPYLAIGFQTAPIAPMTGDVVVAQFPGSLGAYTVSGTSSSPASISGVYFTNGTTNFTGGVLRGEFTRVVTAPLAGSVAFPDLSQVPMMVAYGNGFPAQHIDKASFTVNLLTGASTGDNARSPAVAPKVFAIVILALCALVGVIFTVGLSHTKLGRFCFFRRVTQDSQFLGPRTPACFDLTVGQVALLFTYFLLITIFSRLEFGEAEAPRFVRAMGWTSTLSLACASIPVSRHSVLLYFFGLSFERAILIHRVLARTAILIVLMHFVAVLLEAQYQPFDLMHPLIGPYEIDLSLGFFAFVFMLLMGATSIPLIRRKFFELFYYTHHVFIVVWILAILHNKALVHQLTLLVPLVLWAIDRLIRVYRGRIRRRELVSATIVADALRLEFKGAIASCTTAESGSYAFINVPGVSFFQWHPFSISSRSGAPNFTFHIKNMGPGTYTEALHNYFAANPANPRVNVDGPYGRSAVRFEEYESILLLAGGVGVTPMAAILDHLYEKCKGGNKPPKLEHVSFCWLVQSEKTLAWMQEIIQKIQANPSPVSGVTFDIQVYVTRTKEESALFKTGRPKFADIFASAAHPLGGSKELQVGVLACGPEPMVVECQRQSMIVGYDFHKEIFAF